LNQKLAILAEGLATVKSEERSDCGNLVRHLQSHEIAVIVLRFSSLVTGSALDKQLENYQEVERINIRDQT
jgi:hypothetical protein